MSADRNLLFGILAVQLDFVTRDALVDAMSAWLLDKAKPLGDILRDRGALSGEELQHLSALVGVHVKRHGNDPRRSLAALPSLEPALRRSCAEIDDYGLRHSLAQLTVAPREGTSRDGSGTLPQPPSGEAAAAQPGLRYRILRPHARGGLGEVFIAEDTELGRQVALKEIQGRYADGASRSRFVREAEITGGLEHPGIVPVYGLGRYADGRPFYAMRFIKGDNLLDAIKRFHGTAPDFGSIEFRDLLRRFIDVCNAVAYAHSRGVLHRDLKPGNVMLGKYGETLLVDWGLAKALGRSESPADGDPALLPRSGGDSSSATVAGQALGTPAYMSPEQAEGRIDDLGSATDVYSLGATLYELLAGRTAFHGSPAVPDVLCRVVNGEFPPPRSVLAPVPAPLEAVCLKAMALRPADRYSSATELARDVERWLADEPVTAYPEPAGLRLRRRVRRHARLLTGAVAALTVGVAALAGLAWQRELARRAVAAESAEKEVARAAAVAANEFAQKRLTQVERANEILGTVFQDLDPTTVESGGKPLQAVLGERLDRATAEIEGEAIGDSLAVARMQAILGMSQLGLGYPEKAIRLFTRARATLTAELGPDHPDTLATLSNLAVGYRSAGQIDRALPLYEQALQLMQARLGPDHPDTLTGMCNLASGYQAAGQLGRALTVHEQTLRLRQAKLGPDHPDTLISMSLLAAGYRAAGQLDRALPLFEQSLPQRKARLGPDHPDVLTHMNNLAVCYQAAGQLDRALPLFEQTLQLRKGKLGPDHPDTLASMGSLAQSFRAAGELDRALPLLEQTLQLMKGKLGPDHPETFTGMNNLATGYLDAGKFDAALPLLEQTLQLLQAKLGPDHPNTLGGLSNLAEGYRSAGQLDRAVPLLEQALQRTKAKLGPDHLATLTSMNNLAVSYRDAGRLDAALPLFEEAARAMEQREFRHQHAGGCVGNMVDCLERLGRFGAAEVWRRKWLAIVKERAGPDAPAYAAELAALGHNLIRQHKWADAEATLRECLPVRERTQPDAWPTFNTQSLLGDSLLGQTKTADAEPLLLAGYAGLKQRADKIPNAAKTRLPEAAERLVRLYDALGKPGEAAKWLEEMWAWAESPAPAR